MLAVAVSPGLEELVQEIQQVVPGRRSEEEVLGLVVFWFSLGGFGSENQAINVVENHPLIWESVREAAAGVDRKLPSKLPTADRLYRLFSDVAAQVRAEADPGLSEADRQELRDELRRERHQRLHDAAVQWLARTGCEIARQVGLLRGAEDLRVLERGAVIQVDGTTAKAFSDVSVDADGKVHGSRASGGRPRIAEVHYGKGREQGDGPGLKGVPFVVATVRDDRAQSRVIVGVEYSPERSELAVSRRVIDRVVAHAEGGVAGVVYDKLWQGADMARVLTDHGLVPLVPLRAPRRGDLTVAPPAGLAIPKVSSAKRKPVRPKKVAWQPCGIAEHTASDGRRCCHPLFAVASSLVVGEPGASEPSRHDAVPTIIGVERGRSLVGSTLTVIYECELPCGPLRHVVEFGDKAEKLLNKLHLLPQAIADNAHFYGRRNDVESANDWLHDRLGEGKRASRLHNLRYMLDVIGAAALNNARTYDIWVGRTTTAARREHARITRAIEAAPKAA